MPLASNLTAENRFVGMFVGSKHSGKTCAACSFVTQDLIKKEPKLIKVFDFDGRIRGLLGAPWIDRSLVDYQFFPPKTLDKSKAAVFDRINTECETLLAQAQSPQGSPYGTLIVDSLTAETFALLCDAIPLTHNKQTDKGNSREVGKRIGTMAMPGPEDYGFEANGTYQLMAFLRSLPIPNIIVTAHTVERFGKADPDDPYSETIVVGEKLSIRDKIGTNVMVYFDHIFRFERRMLGAQERFFVRFRSDIANTSYSELPNGEVDITGKDFYKQVLLPYVQEKKGSAT